MKRIVFVVWMLLLFFTPLVRAQEDDGDSGKDYETITESGTYLFEVESVAPDGTVQTVIVPVTIINSTGKVDEELGEGIDARNFRISNEELSCLEELSCVIEHSAAYAWDTTTGEKVSIVSVRSEISDGSGDTFVWLSTDKGTTMSIQVFIHQGDYEKYTNVLEGKGTLEQWHKDVGKYSWIVALCVGVPSLIVIVALINFLLRADKIWDKLSE
ncbi:MAG: hypothetical protein ACK5LZ_06560 [Anaerorhabdus sp.]